MKLMDYQYPNGNADFREYVAECAKDVGRDIKILEPGYLDEAIVGIDTETSRVIYDVDLLVAVYVKEMYKSDSDVFGNTPDDIYNCAVDQVYNDTIHVCLRLGDEGPIVISRFFALDGVDEA